MNQCNMSMTKEYRPHGAVWTTEWGCPQEEGPPHDNMKLIEQKICPKINCKEKINIFVVYLSKNINEACEG